MGVRFSDETSGYEPFFTHGPPCSPAVRRVRFCPISIFRFIQIYQGTYQQSIESNIETMIQEFLKFSTILLVAGSVKFVKFDVKKLPKLLPF